MAVKHVIVVRADLHMRKGKVGAQVSHAVRHVMTSQLVQTSPTPDGLAYDMTYRIKPEVHEWLSNGASRVIVARAESEFQLLGLAAQAERSGIPIQDIIDAGLTEFRGTPTRTCIGFGPAEEELLGPITGHLPLL